jgi:hypothetical protein
METTMPRLCPTLFVTVLGFVTGLGAAWAPAEAQSPAPRARAAELVFDAGAVERGDTVSHAFALRNEGDAPLEIREVRPTCGCTVADFDASIPPGGEGRVTTEVDTSSFQGPIAKSVTVYTNDTENPAIQLTVKADVRALVSVVPDYVRALGVRGGEPVRTRHTIWFPGSEPHRVTGVRSPLPHLRAEVREAKPEERSPDGPERQWLLVTELDAEAPAGPLAGNVVVTTTHPRRPEYLLPITGYVREPLMTMPPRLDLGRFSPLEPRKGGIVVANFGSPDVEITGSRSDVAGLRATIEKSEDGKRFDVYVTLEPGHPPGIIDGTLTLETTNERAPVVTVPIRGVVE